MGKQPEGVADTLPEGGKPRQKRRLEMTPAWVTSVKAEAGPVEWTDTRREGLVLRVERSGRKTWWLRYLFEEKGRRFKLGDAKTLTLSEARDTAKDRGAEATTGTDPQAEKLKLRAGDTVKAALETWLADEKVGPAARWKGGLEGGSARSFLPHVRRFKRELGEKRLVTLTQKDVESFVSGPEAVATRNRALTVLRTFFKWAKRRALLDADPSAQIEKETNEAVRSRTLTDAELRALVVGFDPTRYGPAVRLLVLTGLRRDEALGAEWSWFDSEAATLTIPPEAEKAGRVRGEARRVALPKAAVALLTAQRERLMAEGLRSSRFIFPTASGERPHPDALKPTLYLLRGMRSNGQPRSPRAKARPAVLPDDVTIHDLRRTAADALRSRLSVAPWVVDYGVLGHVRPKLIRTYMPTLPLGEARAALDRWAEMVEAILSAQPVAENGTR